jgi:hypothetical protein
VKDQSGGSLSHPSRHDCATEATSMPDRGFVSVLEK